EVIHEPARPLAHLGFVAEVVASEGPGDVVGSEAELRATRERIEAGYERRQMGLTSASEPARGHQFQSREPRERGRLGGGRMSIDGELERTVEGVGDDGSLRHPIRCPSTKIVRRLTALTVHLAPSNPNTRARACAWDASLLRRSHTTFDARSPSSKWA